MGNRSLVLYGATGTFKTANVGFVAKYIYEKTGKKTRYVYGDGGSFSHISSLVKAEIIDPLVIVDDPNPIELMRGIVHDKLWPVGLDETFRRTGPKSTKDMSQVGAYIFEGITSIGELLHSTYRGKQTAMKSAYSQTIQGVLVDEKGSKGNSSWQIGSLSQDSYGLVQIELTELLLKSWILPVELVMWTGHESQGVNEQTKRPFRGVALVGNAATARIGKKIGDLIHAIQIPKAKGSLDMETRYYFQNHADPNFPDIPWEAKPRVPSSQIDKLLAKFPNGFLVPTKDKGLDEFLRVEDSLMDADDANVEKWKLEVDKKRKEVESK